MEEWYSIEMEGDKLLEKRVGRLGRSVAPSQHWVLQKTSGLLVTDMQGEQSSLAPGFQGCSGSKAFPQGGGRQKRRLLGAGCQASYQQEVFTNVSIVVTKGA